MRPKAYFTSILIFLLALTAFAQNNNPFQNIGKKGNVLTLSKGRYNEFFDQDSIQQIGTALINIRQMKIVKLFKNEKEAQNRLDNSSNSRFLSVDPLTSTYPMLTPYQYASNSPIAGTDLDGLEFKYYGLNWKDQSYTKLRVGNLVRTDNDISMTLVFRVGDIDGGSKLDFVKVSVPRSAVGLSGTFVNYKNQAVQIPDEFSNNLPAQTDPIWESFKTDQEVDENFVGAVNQITSTIQNVSALKSLLSAGGFVAWLKKNGLHEKVAELEKARRSAVRNAWAQERELVMKTGRGSGQVNWTKKEMEELKKRGKVKGYEGHHINDVANNPNMAGDADNIEFVKGRKGNLDKHGGNYQNPTSGPTVDRQKILNDRIQQSNGNQ